MISVIIPVYNAEDFLEEAILSVFSQTYTDWELILVDDGSTDRSSLICDKASKQNNRVTVVHTSNNGVSHARNVGLKLAKGAYITFVDADDLLAPSALETMLNVATETDVDIVCAGIKEFTGKDPFYTVSNLSSKKDIVSISSYTIRTSSGTEAAIDSLYQKNVDNSVWGKLYASHLWTALHFKEGIRYEDLDICYKIFLKAKSIASVNRALYFYRQHNASYIHTFIPSRADALKVTAGIVEYVATNCPMLLPAARSRQLSANFNILGLIVAIVARHTPVTSKIADDCREKIKELRGESLRNPNVRIKNKIGIIVSYIMGRKGVEFLSRIVYRN